MTSQPPIEIPKSSVRHVTERQWQRATELLTVGAVIELAWLRSATGMRRDSANQLMDELAIRGACPERALLVYHGCAEHPAFVGKSEDIRFPWTCPECEDVVSLNDDDALRYEVRLKLGKPVRFI